MRTPKREANESPAERLLAAILAGTGGLEGAACRGDHALFDPRDHDHDETPVQAYERHTGALRICQRCPVIDRCRVWAESESTHGGARGVLAGQIPRTDGCEDAA